VERRENGELAERGLNMLVERHGVPEPLAAVDDAVPDDVGLSRQLAKRSADLGALDDRARRSELAGPHLRVVRVEQR